MIEWLASLTNLLFVNECLEGKKKNYFKPLSCQRKKGIEMQMRETEIPKIKNQEDA